MIMKYKKILVLILILGTFLITPSVLIAGDGGAHETPDSNSVRLDNPLGKGVTNPTDIYGNVIYTFMGMAGSVALIMFIIGGFTWMTAGGNQEKITKGRDTLVWAVLGLVLIFASYAIIRAILENLKF